LPERLEKATELIKSFGLAGITNTMNSFNGK
jgi:PTH1 family peptidyl-tRNA hydrolase